MDIGKYNVLVMRAESKPWQMGDASGISSTLRFMYQGKVFKARITQQLFDTVKDIVQEEAEVELSLDVYQETPRLICKSVS